MRYSIFLAGSALAAAAFAQQSAYGQCGGIYWTGATSCVAGYKCQYGNPYYSQCLPEPVPSGQQSAWGQCGGTGWTGATICAAGCTCQYSNPYYSRCLPGTATPVAPSTTPATTWSTGNTTTVASSTEPTTTWSTGNTTTVASSTEPSTTWSTRTGTTAPTTSATGLKWLGVNEAGAEFGSNIPGALGTDYSFPNSSTIDTLIAEGYNMFRVPFSMERMARGSITAQFDAEYLARYTATINHITDKGAYAVVDPHNYGRYDGAVIQSTDDFASFWTKLATQFKSNSKVVFDTNNEYHDEDQTLVLKLNQAAINAIRATGATSQYIFAEGNSYSGASTWTQVNDNLKGLIDPNDMLLYEMHQYLDGDGSGTHDTCTSSTIGAERLVSATTWLRANGKKGVLGEFAGGPNDVCLSAVQGLLKHLRDNSDVWQGALWWAAGPLWPPGTFYLFEPPSGQGYAYYDSTLKKYLPGQ